jgi:hypothetical protein
MKTKTFRCERNRFAETVRKYVASQKRWWRQIPWLALQNDGRFGYSEHFKEAYIHKLWPIYRRHIHQVIAYVDLKTGDLVYRSIGKPTPCMDETVIEIASDPKQIDAKEIVLSLKKGMRKRHSSYYIPRQQKKERRILIRRLGLKRIVS